MKDCVDIGAAGAFGLTTGLVCISCEGRAANFCRVCHNEHARFLEEYGHRTGAAVAFGLMGMAEAIRERDPQRASWFHYERYRAAATRYAEAIDEATYVSADGRRYRAWMP